MSPGPGKSTMSDINLSSNSDSQNLTIPKLRDDGSNWADYEPRVTIAMKAKGIWKHVQGVAYEPKPYANVNGIHLLAEGKHRTTRHPLDYIDSSWREDQKPKVSKGDVGGGEKGRYYQEHPVPH